MISFLQNRLNGKVRKFIRPDETLQAAFIASTRPTWVRQIWLGAGMGLALASAQLIYNHYLFAVLLAGAIAGGVAFIYTQVTPYRIIAVTDQRILVLAHRWTTTATPTHVLRELPRSTRLGARLQIDGLGEPLWVDRGDKVVRAADAVSPA